MGANLKDNLPYVHHEQGYSKLSRYQQNILNRILYYVTNATKSLNKIRDDAQFVVVDYGAADGVNSVPMIAECSAQLSPNISEFIWIINDTSIPEVKTVIPKIKEQVKEFSRDRDTMVSLQFLPGNFYTRVALDESVDLAVSVNALHWLSHRPPVGCNLDLQKPDEITRRIAAQDWVDFLLSRARELKQGGRMVIQAYITSSQNSHELRLTAPQQVIQDMFEDGMITKEEYDYARVFPITLRTEADLKAPFLDRDSDLSHSVQLMSVETCDIPDPFYYQWMSCGGPHNRSATNAYITAVVDNIKSFYNSFWQILNRTRTKELRLEILENFYSRVEVFMTQNLDGYRLNLSIAIVEITKEAH